MPKLASSKGGTARIYNGSKISMREERKWYASATEIIVRLAYLSLPIFEILHLYLYDENGTNKDESFESKSELFQEDGLRGVLKYTDSPLKDVHIDEFNQIRSYIQIARSIIDSKPPRNVLMDLKPEPLLDEDDIRRILERTQRVCELVKAELHHKTKQFANELNLKFE